LQRSRSIYFIAILATIGLGLLSRRFPLFPAALGKYPGDALWALMVFLGLGFWFRCSRTIKIALAALAFSFAIETSQLYHAPWIDSLRATLPGRLILGSGFTSIDFIAYAAGILIGVIAESLISLRAKRKNAGPV